MEKTRKRPMMVIHHVAKPSILKPKETTIFSVDASMRMTTGVCSFGFTCRRNKDGRLMFWGIGYQYLHPGHGSDASNYYEAVGVREIAELGLEAGYDDKRVVIINDNNTTVQQLNKVSKHARAKEMVQVSQDVDRLRQYYCKYLEYPENPMIIGKLERLKTGIDLLISRAGHAYAAEPPALKFAEQQLEEAWDAIEQEKPCFPLTEKEIKALNFKGK